MRQPQGFVEDPKLVCKLNKSLYSLKQAALEWNLNLHQTFMKFGFRQITSDNCVYVRSHQGKLTYFGFHVDNCMIVGERAQV
jgi:hypothetical protein